MAEAPHIPHEAEVLAKCGSFAFAPAYKAKAEIFMGRYPTSCRQSAGTESLDIVSGECDR